MKNPTTTIRVCECVYAAANCRGIDRCIASLVFKVEVNSDRIKITHMHTHTFTRRTSAGGCGWEEVVIVCAVVDTRDSLFCMCTAQNVPHTRCCCCCFSNLHMNVRICGMFVCMYVCVRARIDALSLATAFGELAPMSPTRQHITQLIGTDTEMCDHVRRAAPPAHPKGPTSHMNVCMSHGRVSQYLVFDRTENIIGYIA